MRRLSLDLRGVTTTSTSGPLAIVGGIPLFVRVLRMAGRAGFEHAALVADDGERATVERVLVQHPVPLTVELVGAPPAGALALDPRGIYDREGLTAAVRDGTTPEPRVCVRGPGDRRAARRALTAMVRKSMQADGVLSYFLYRPLFAPLVWLLLPTPITANQVTMIAMVMGVVTAVALAAATGAGMTIACVLTAGALALDHVDGDLARLRVRGSRLGEWLDTIADDVTTFAPMAGAGVGMWRAGYHPAWMAVLIGGALVASLVHARMYVELARLGLPIDTAHYPWAFGSGVAAPSRPRGVVGALGSALNYLARRDVFMTAVAVVLALHAWLPLALILAARGLAMVPLMGVHLALRGRRR